MGDRANVKVVEGGRELYFYTHWAGTELPALVAEGLRRGKDRWYDPPYLNRIIFCTLLDGDDGTTGYGISAHVTGAARALVIDHDRQWVHLDLVEGTDGGGWSFADYAVLASHAWDDLEQIAQVAP